MLQKSHIILLNKNIKLKEKYYINKKTHLAKEKIFVVHHSLKINKRGDGVLISSGGGRVGKKSKN